MEVRRPARAGAVNTRTQRADLDTRGDPVGAVAALAVPDDRTGVGVRAVRAARNFVSTPARAAFTTAWGFGLIISLACLLPTSRTTLTASGPARVECGLDVFLYGYPDAAVARVCRSAEVSRLALFVPALLLVVLGVACAAVGAARASGPARQRWSQVAAWMRCFPVPSGLILLGVLATPAMFWSIRPAPAQLTTDGALNALQCGPDSYFLGFPDRAVQVACTQAYGPRAHVLVGAGCLVLIGLAVAATSWIRSGSGRRDRIRRFLLCGTALLTVGAVVSLWPVAVEVNVRGQAFLARCALDTYLGGYPVPVIQSTCRARFAPHVAEGGALLGLAAVLLLARRALVSSARTPDR